MLSPCANVSVAAAAANGRRGDGEVLSDGADSSSEERGGCCREAMACAIGEDTSSGSEPARSSGERKLDREDSGGVRAGAREGECSALREAMLPTE